MTTKPKLLLVSAQWGHLAGHSGLSPLRPHLEARFDVVQAVPSDLAKARSSLSQGVSVVRQRVFGQAKYAGWSPFYTRQGVLLENEARRMLSSETFDCVLFEALEDHFDAFRRWRAEFPSTRFSGISHQPPSWWRFFGCERDVFKGLDGVLTFSQQSAEFVQSETGCTEARFFNHGVDTSFFLPTELRRRPSDGVFDVLFCGKWLRDFRQLEETIRVLNRAGESFRFHLVVPKSFRNIEAHYRLACFDNVKWYSGISDESLRDLYQHAHLVFLPLLDATANNSVLEGLASGTPMLVSRVGGVVDYALEGTAVFLAGDQGEDGAAGLKWCRDNYEHCLQMAENGRRRATDTLSWEIVGPKIANWIVDGSAIES